MTGEMHYTSIQKGGEHYGWAQQIRRAAISLQRRTHLHFISMKPFDVYQGPYAQMNYGTLWSGETEGQFFYDGLGIKIQGTIPDIAAEVNKAVEAQRKG